MFLLLSSVLHVYGDWHFNNVVWMAKLNIVDYVIFMLQIFIEFSMWGFFITQIINMDTKTSKYYFWWKTKNRLHDVEQEAVNAVCHMVWFLINMYALIKCHHHPLESDCRHNEMAHHLTSVTMSSHIFSCRGS